MKHATNHIGWFCKKRDYFENKLKENIVEPNNLWKTLKSLDLSKNFSVAEANLIEDNKRLKHDLKSVAQTFVKFYCKLAGSLL